MLLTEAGTLFIDQASQPNTDFSIFLPLKCCLFVIINTCLDISKTFN